MSWDCTVVYKDTKEDVKLDKPIDIRGGTYNMFGTNELWLNVTYNYSQFYRKKLPESLRTLDGMDVKESIPILQDLANSLGDDKTSNYWEPTEGNAKAAILKLLKLAELAPENTMWEVD